MKNFDDFNQEAKQFKRILTNYKKTGVPFVDQNFLPSCKTKERFKFRNCKKKNKWIRLDEIYDAPLFQKDLIHPNYVIQGKIGNCYFISALSHIAKYPHLIQSFFDTETPNKILGSVPDSINIKCGAVVVYFYCFGRRTPVLIDTLMPFSSKLGKLRFSRPSLPTYSPWFCLVEKAYAKLYESYSNIEKGLLCEAIHTLIGYEPIYKYINSLQQKEKVDKMPLFERLLKYQNQGALLGASINMKYHDNNVTQRELRSKNLIKNHTYTVLKVTQCGDKRFVCLRNPWGRKEWSGDWSNNSPLWTPTLKEQLEFDNLKNGTFLMSDHDFFKYFTTISLPRPISPHFHCRQFNCQIKPGRDDGHSVCDPRTYLSSKPNFALQVVTPIQSKCRLHFIVENRGRTFKNKSIFPKKPPFYSVNLALLNGRKFDSTTFFNRGLTKFTSNYSHCSFVYDVMSNFDIVTIMVNRIEKSRMHEDFVISIYSEYDFILYDIDNPDQIIPEKENILNEIIMPINIYNELLKDQNNDEQKYDENIEEMINKNQEEEVDIGNMINEQAVMHRKRRRKTHKKIEIINDDQQNEEKNNLRKEDQEINEDIIVKNNEEDSNEQVVMHRKRRRKTHKKIEIINDDQQNEEQNNLRKEDQENNEDIIVKNNEEDSNEQVVMHRKRRRKTHKKIGIINDDQQNEEMINLSKEDQEINEEIIRKNSEEIFSEQTKIKRRRREENSCFKNCNHIANNVNNEEHCTLITTNDGVDKVQRKKYTIKLTSDENDEDEQKISKEKNNECTLTFNKEDKKSLAAKQRKKFNIPITNDPNKERAKLITKAQIVNQRKIISPRRKYSIKLSSDDSYEEDGNYKSKDRKAIPEEDEEYEELNTVRKPMNKRRRNNAELTFYDNDENEETANAQIEEEASKKKFKGRMLNEKTINIMKKEEEEVKKVNVEEFQAIENDDLYLANILCRMIQENEKLINNKSSGNVTQNEVFESEQKLERANIQFKLLKDKIEADEFDLELERISKIFIGE
ncbi:hypothetical protein M9Y10_006791 [Tritrichomonas musculus]|uniref:Calpain catalytic domain-containing protein n=1 Tax=Tritrichomonas musculus TaxID=1915356 RepID=A0ABR2JF46_9EUKA